MSRRGLHELHDDCPDSGRRGEDVSLIEDPDLPGAGLILSPASLAAWLTESLGRPCTVELRRLRYKPGTSVVLGFDLTSAPRPDGTAVTEPCVAWAYADHAAAKIAKTLERVPAGACLAHDPAHVLVTTAAGDRALPFLPRMAEPDGMTRLLDRLLPDDPDPGRAWIRPVRHNPGRRWVGVLEREGEPDLLLRAYAGAGRLARAGRSYKTLGRSAVPTPRLVAKSRSFAVLAVSWVEGEVLELAGGEDRWRAAGRSLAHLHDSGPVKLPTPEPGEDVAALHRAARQIAELLPELADEARAIAGTAARLLGEAPRDTVPVHGDFSADQVVVGADGVPVLIDLDSAHWGASASDLGCLVASTLTQAESLGRGPQGERDVAALLAGYLGVRRPPDRFAVDVHEVAFRLRKAADPFRTCAPDWAEQVTLRVQRTRAALDAVAPADLSR
jgi:tRNA A-37 threonylcarbamoyl transferase component Bud32